MLSNGLVYLCMAEESFSRRNCFMFLAVNILHPSTLITIITRMHPVSVARIIQSVV